MKAIHYVPHPDDRVFSDGYINVGEKHFTAHYDDEGNCSLDDVLDALQAAGVEIEERQIPKREEPLGRACGDGLMQAYFDMIANLHTARHARQCPIVNLALKGETP
jgi:catechol 2,3-dioxygenase-like lactoylglutathione lyase family enzyme